MKKKIFREFVLPCAFCFIFSYAYSILLNKVFGVRADYPFNQRRYLTLFLTPISAMIYWFIRYSWTFKGSIEKGNKNVISQLGVKIVLGLLFCIISFSIVINSTFSIYTLIILMMFFVSFTLIYLLIEKRSDIIDKFNENIRLKIAVYIFFILVLPIILLGKYLFGGYAFLFGDIAGDSLYQMYPELLHVAERIHNGQWGSGFAFTIGIGNAESAIFPNIQNWVALFGIKNVAYLIGISLYFKMALSGILAFGLAKQFAVSDDVSIIIALGYEFCSMLTIRACWQAYSIIAFSVIFWLFFFEYVYRYERKLIAWVLYGLATEICFLQFSTYFCVLFGGIFFVYITCRFFTEKRSLTSWIKYIVVFIMFVLFAIADSFLEEFTSSASSSRITGGYSSAFKYIYFRWQMLYEAFIRTIGQTIQGISGDFVGINNVLEGPAFYFGILMLLLVPVAFYNIKKSKKILFGIGLIGSVLFIGVPFLREVVAGFSGASFKYTSFWITVLYVIMIMEAFRNIQIEGYRNGSLLVFNITAGICLYLHISILYSGEIARIKSWWLSLAYILIYTVCINLSFLHKKQYKALVIAAVISEGLVLSWGVLNGDGRAPVTVDSLKDRFHNNVYYAMEKNKENDSGWYRSETYPISTTNSGVQGYYGTATYIGGVGINSSVQKYINELRLPSSGVRSIYGTQGNLYANSLLGVKYIFSTDTIDYYGIKYIDTYDGVNIYENTLALPLGVFYDKEIDHKEFESMTYLERAKELLDKCLVQEPGEEVNSGEDHYASYGEDYIELAVSQIESGIDVSDYHEDLYAIELQFSNEDIKTNEDDSKDTSINKAYLDLFNGTGSDEVIGKGTVNYETSDGTVRFKDFAYGGVIEIDSENVNKIWFDENTLSGIDSIKLYVRNRDKYYADVVEAIKDRQNNSLVLTSIKENDFSGTIKVSNDGIFATSIPYDNRWDIFIDGNKQKTYQVNTGFVGCYMSKGQHDVHIIYASEPWLESNKYRGFGLFCVAVCCVICLMKNMKRGNS